MDLDHYYRCTQYHRLDFLNCRWVHSSWRRRAALSRRKVLFCILLCCYLVPTKLNANRIISLSPNLTEILWDIGAGPQLIARDRSSCYPRAVRSLPVVWDYHHLNIEAILRLQPDMVVVESSPFLKC